MATSELSIYASAEALQSFELAFVMNCGERIYLESDSDSSRGMAPTTAKLGHRLKASQ